MHASGTWHGGFETKLDDGRGHFLTVDLPREEGGGDLGPSALELCVQSLAGCISTIFALVAKKRRLKVEAVTVKLRANRPARAPTITDVSGEVHVTTLAPREEVAQALDLTLRICPVGVIFDRAGIPLRIRLAVAAPVAPR